MLKSAILMLIGCNVNSTVCCLLLAAASTDNAC
jgi:hypothetical protein